MARPSGNLHDPTRIVRQKNTAMGHTEPATKHHCADEAQQESTRPTDRKVALISATQFYQVISAT
jgi:hypothetical protein